MIDEFDFPFLCGGGQDGLQDIVGREAWLIAAEDIDEGSMN